MEFLIILIILIFIGYNNFLRDKSENTRLQSIIDAMQKEPKEEKEIQQIITDDIDEKDEIIELENVDPEQLIQQLHDNNKN